MEAEGGSSLLHQILELSKICRLSSTSLAILHLLRFFDNLTADFLRVAASC
jgi:hypothetical protein